LATPIPEFSCERNAHVDNGHLGIGEIQEFLRITDLPASTFKLVTLFSLHVYRSANDQLLSHRVVTSILSSWHLRPIPRIGRDCGIERLSPHCSIRNRKPA